MATPMMPAADPLKQQADNLMRQINDFNKVQVSAGVQIPQPPDFTNEQFQKQIDTLKSMPGVDPKTITAIETHLQQQFDDLKKGDFSKSKWDAGFNITDPAAQAALDSMKTTAATDQVRAMQRTATNQIQNLKSQTIEANAKQAYGIDYKEKLHHKLTQGVDSGEDSQFSMKGSSKVEGGDGFYKRAGSNILLTVENGVVTPTLDIDVKKKKWLFEFLSPTKINFKEAVRESMEFLAVQQQSKTVTLDMTESHHTQFNSNNVKEIKQFIAEGRAMLEKRQKTGEGPVVDVALSAGAEKLLREATWFVASKSEKEKIFASMAALNADVAAFRQSEDLKKSAAAAVNPGAPTAIPGSPPPATAAPTVAATAGAPPATPTTGTPPPLPITNTGATSTTVNSTATTGIGGLESESSQSRRPSVGDDGAGRYDGAEEKQAAGDEEEKEIIFSNIGNADGGGEPSPYFSEDGRPKLSTSLDDSGAEEKEDYGDEDREVDDEDVDLDMESDEDADNKRAPRPGMGGR
jgi:hypothetical protein